MTTCNDCLYAEMCNDHLCYGFTFEGCTQCKDRSRFVELPCKVGDTVYFADDAIMLPAEVDTIRIREDGIFCEWVQWDRSYETAEVWDTGEFKPDDIGKTVFLTREEAEAELARRTVNG